MNILHGNEQAYTGPQYTQVYQATHEGELRLPFMKRSFISFSYGGKNIEDFSLLATIEGDRLDRQAYASFNDLTTDYDVIQGQFYWGTHYHTNSITFNLATDAMTERELDEFKRWFRAGQLKELILAEHPNRAILARVSAPPELKLLPFEQPITLQIGSGGAEGSEEQTTIREYKTSTTVYRGEITLNFIMDEPFWYAKQNLLGIQDVAQGYYTEQWVDANGVQVNVRDNKDALKIIYEDRIPLGSTTTVSVFLGGDTYAVVEYQDWQRIATNPGMVSKADYYAIITNNELGPFIKYSYFKIDDQNILTYAADDTASSEDDSTYTYYKGATIAIPTDITEDKYIGGRIGGADLTSTAEKVEGISLLPMAQDGKANLYYAGTAPSPVKIQFTLRPAFSQDYKIINPNNKYGTPEKPYSTITFKATQEHKFQFSLPTIYYSYNQILQIFDNEDIMADGNAWLLVRETIRDTIKDPYIRAWANRIIDLYDSNTGGVISGLSNIRGIMKKAMEYLFLDDDDGAAQVGYVSGAQAVGFPATFMFDGKTGTAIGKITIRNPFDINNNFTPNPSKITDLASEIKQYTTTIEIEQNVGDMVKSNYLILDERNVLDEKFQVQAWEEAHPDYAYLITHDLSGSLENVHFEFKNLYL